MPAGRREWRADAWAHCVYTASLLAVGATLASHFLTHMHPVVRQSGLEYAPAGQPNYLNAAVGPSKLYAARKFCSVCGFESP